MKNNSKNNKKNCYNIASIFIFKTKLLQRLTNMSSLLNRTKDYLAQLSIHILEGAMCLPFLKNTANDIDDDNDCTLFSEKRRTVITKSKQVFNSFEWRMIGLKEKHMKGLANLLRNGWKDIAWHIFIGNKFAIEEINCFEKQSAFESANTFLLILLQKKPDLTVQDVIKVCQKIHRNDVLKFFCEHEIKGNDLVSGLHVDRPHLFAKMVVAIEGFCPNYAGWRCFAGEFGFGVGECDSIARSVGHTDEPPVLLIKLIQQVKPDMTLASFASICKHFNMNNVCYEMEEIMNDLDENFEKSRDYLERNRGNFGNFQ